MPRRARPRVLCCQGAMPPDAADTTCDFAESVGDASTKLAPRAPVAFARGPATQGELPALLRTRLRFACLLFAGFYTYSLLVLLRRYLDYDTIPLLDAVYVA